MTSLITPTDRIRELPMVPQRRRPDHAELRQRMPWLGSSSADLIRADRER